MGRRHICCRQAGAAVRCGLKEDPACYSPLGLWGLGYVLGACLDQLISSVRNLKFFKIWCLLLLPLTCGEGKLVGIDVV